MLNLTKIDQMIEECAQMLAFERKSGDTAAEQRCLMRLMALEVLCELNDYRQGFDRIQEIY
jgi:hypothetical protein